jgi:hypothetical protein
MKITFKSPIFYSIEDENTFFHWIYGLPAYENVTGYITDLNLQLKSPVDETTVRNLLIIFRRWCIDITPLLPLKTVKNQNLALWNSGIEQATRNSENQS